VKFKTDEIIRVKIGKTLNRNYKAYKGTFAVLAFNSVEKKALPGLYEEGLVVGAERKDKTLSLKLSGNRLDDALMEIMDIALRNVSAFPREGGRAHFSITIEGTK
jgi:hypothetical protein